MWVEQLSDAQRSYLFALARMKRMTWWTATYEWMRFRVRLEQWSGDAFEFNGKLVVVQGSTTGLFGRLWIPSFWWRRRQVLKDRGLPSARLLR